MSSRVRLSLIEVILVCVTWTTAVPNTLTIAVPQATVRAGPGMTQPIVTTVPQGGIFPILDTAPEWVKILLDDGRQGWVMHKVGEVTSEPASRGVAVIPATPAPAAPERLALVIGNGAYDADLGPLRNSLHDAEDMAVRLRQLDFSTTLVLNGTLRQMQDAIEAFSQQLRQGQIGLFYYAGHGVQVNGSNHLIPLGANLVHAADVQPQTMAAEQVLDSMAAAGNPLNIVILDACRNNPFPQRWPSAKPGLAPMTAARGALIAYATAPGAVAADGEGRNGTYTKHLLHTLAIPSLLIEQVFKRVRVAVEAETAGTQVPWESSSLRGDVILHAPAPATAVLPSLPPTAASPPVPVPSPPSAPTPALPVQDGAEMVLVPAGTFPMGTTAGEITALLRQYRGGSRAAFADELPRHRVFVEAFYIDKYEVTNARFQQFVQATEYRTQAEKAGGGKIRVQSTMQEKWETVPAASWRSPKGQGSTIAGLETHPVVQVTWNDAKAYCAWAGKRLPTEAEWEKAARGTDGRAYPWSNVSEPARMNFCDRRCPFPERLPTVDDGYAETAPVGSFEAGKSPFGVYDMAGNVWEWLADWYNAAYYQHSPEHNPAGPPTGSEVVIRGGSWLYATLAARVAARSGVPPDRRNNNIGFRCVKTP